MPTINFQLKDFEKLVGKKFDLRKLRELLEYAKAELDDYDRESDTITVSFADTNLPCFWSVELLALFIKGILGIEKGIPKIEVKKGNYKIIVYKSIAPIRPYIAALIARGKPIDESLLLELVQTQEKLCENYGRRRQKLSIGIYKFKNISWPLHYKAVKPESIRFVPLEFTKALNLKEILEQHPKGRQYANILAPFKLYPIFIDDKGDVLSFPPIINSNTTGKIVPGDSELLVEVTGIDESSVNLAANIFAQVFYERGFSLYSVEIEYSNKKNRTPLLKTQKIKIDSESVQRILGIELSNSQIKELIERARCGFKNGIVEIPHFRQDVMHSVDIIEDVGIMYGYNKLGVLPLSKYTKGATFDLTTFLDKSREIMIGLGYQEIMSPILSNKEYLYEKCNIQDFGTIEIENPMSNTYSAVRSWLIPVLLEVLSKNKHVDYPQRIFEQGAVVLRKDKNVYEYERIAALTAHSNADFTEAKQAADALLRYLGVDYEIEEEEHNSFIKGRVARIIINEKKVGFVGELSPVVLSNFGLLVPVSGFEINLSDIFSIMKLNK